MFKNLISTIDALLILAIRFGFWYIIFALLIGEYSIMLWSDNARFWFVVYILLTTINISTHVKKT